MAALDFPQEIRPPTASLFRKMYPVSGLKLKAWISAPLVLTYAPATEPPAYHCAEAEKAPATMHKNVIINFFITSEV